MSQDIPNFLLRRPSRPYNPYSGWKTYKDKEIVFDSKEHIMHWDVHPDGILVEIERALFVNGKDRVYRKSGGGDDSG